ncbi:MAG: hypothetical protein FWC61_04675 [Proteobacteria bacterium]|nr:hypothetical protein [Pseudomonadota bacterium]
MITKETPINPEEMVLKFTNGDLRTFNKIMEKYDFVDEEALVRFAMSILVLTEDKQLKIKQNGDFTLVTPAASLVKPKEA